MMTTSVYTIGHSTHSAEEFVALLRRHQIAFVIDVRSVPFSRRSPWFNKGEVRWTLQQSSIRYLHLPDEFGARRYEPSVLNAHGQVDFDLVRSTAVFRQGVERVKKGASAGHRIALMCAEEDPLRCHRFAMISYQLAKEGLRVVHIRGSGDTVDNDELEERLWVEVAHHLQWEIFHTDELLQRPPVEVAYKLLEREVAFNTRAAGRPEGESR